MELITLARTLISIPSPTGGEEEISRFLGEQLRSTGFPEVFRDEYRSVAAVIPGRSSRTLVLDGHMDTVSVADENAWSYPPYDGALVREPEGGERIYGRGASDMKGALAAMITALSGLLASDGGGRSERPPCTVALTATAAEETYEGYALGKMLENLRGRGYEPAAVLIGEASSLKLMHGQRGRAELRLSTRGKPAHSAHPEAGVNAVTAMAELLTRLEELEPPSDPDLGRGIAAVTDIISSPYPGASVIPEACTVTIDRRTVSGETEETVLAPIRQLLRGAAGVRQGIDGGVDIVTRPLTSASGRDEPVRQFHPAWKLETGHPLMQAASAALREAGISVQFGTYDFCTNGSRSDGIEGIPTLGFGPSREELAHVTDEYVEVSQLEKAVRGYSALIAHLSRWIAS